MKARYWSLAIVLLLINYLIFAALFSQLMQSDFTGAYATRTPVPTFTPAPVEPFIIIPTLTPVPIEPTPTATLVVSNGDAQSNAPASNPADQAPVAAAQAAQQTQLVAPGSVNIRSGPGLNFAVIGTLSANTSRPVVGRNADRSWWQIKISENEIGWVASSVVQTSNTAEVALVEVAPPANAPIPAGQPAASNPAPEKPKYQYTPTGWYDDTNAGLTRFLGDIKDTSGNPINGVFVRASCGHYSTISFPSGPTGWGTRNESSDWPAGFYDIAVDDRPVPCVWVLTIVDTDDRQTVKGELSEAIPVEVTADKSVIVANWQKNW
jgi:uncharacterized protein YgiM (DUF1202 family)